MSRRSMECRFADRLLRWRSSDRRELSRRALFWWRGTQDPYSIFVAEVLLARTRADRVARVSLDLVRRWPSFCDLANANEAELIEILRPLGFQRVRANALKRAAREVCERWEGELPLDEEVIASLPRSGRYVANAVLAYVRCEPRVAVDVNVARVLSRGFDVPVGKELHRDERIWALAGRLGRCVEGCRIRDLNWALLDVGREFCKPKRPKCAACPLSGVCRYSSRARGVD